MNTFDLERVDWSRLNMEDANTPSLSDEEDDVDGDDALEDDGDEEW